jgi:hypothetical protein
MEEVIKGSFFVDKDGVKEEHHFEIMNRPE